MYIFKVNGPPHLWAGYHLLIVLSWVQGFYGLWAKKAFLWMPRIWSSRYNYRLLEHLSETLVWKVGGGSNWIFRRKTRTLTLHWLPDNFLSQYHISLTQEKIRVQTTFSTKWEPHSQYNKVKICKSKHSNSMTDYNVLYWSSMGKDRSFRFWKYLDFLLFLLPLREGTGVCYFLQQQQQEQQQQQQKQ